MKRTNTLLAFLFVLSLVMMLFTACDDSGSIGSSDQNIIEVTETNDDLGGFSAIVKENDVTAYLEGDGPFTVFAPKNDAIKTLPNGIGAPGGKVGGDLDKEELGEILKYHVLNSEISTSDLEAAQTVEAAAGGELFITREGGEVRINDTATVTNADIGASNGVIHTIDQFLMPDKYQDVVGIISKRYMLQTLEDAISDADLTETLKESGGDGYTIFAPSDSAFEGEGLDLSGLPQEELQAMLTYHVLPNKVLSGDLSASQTVKTVNGGTLDIAFSGEGTVSLTDKAGSTYQVIDADLEGTNGVVHIIDGVLMPE